MTYFRFALVGAFATAFLLGETDHVRAANKDKVDVEQNVRAGLDWLAKQQIKRNDEGWWEANGGMYPTTMTGMAGMAFLLEGSTMKEGRYSENIRKGVTWFLKRSQSQRAARQSEQPDRSEPVYVWSWASGCSFLPRVYGEEDDEKKRKELEKLLSKAVLFCGKAQTDRGGWGYVSAADGGGFDEGSVTITQVAGTAGGPKCGNSRSQGDHRQSGQVFARLHDSARRHHLQPRSGVPPPAANARLDGCGGWLRLQRRRL